MYFFSVTNPSFKVLLSPRRLSPRNTRRVTELKIRDNCFVLAVSRILCSYKRIHCMKYNFHDRTVVKGFAGKVGPALFLVPDLFLFQNDRLAPNGSCSSLISESTKVRGCFCVGRVIVVRACFASGV